MSAAPTSGSTSKFGTSPDAPIVSLSTTPPVPLPADVKPPQSPSLAGETEPNGEPTAPRVISPQPGNVHSTTALMQTSQRLDSGARMARTASNCAMSQPERPAHSAGRAAQKKRESVE